MQFECGTIGGLLSSKAMGIKSGDYVGESEAAEGGEKYMVSFGKEMMVGW